MYPYVCADYSRISFACLYIHMCKRMEYIMYLMMHVSCVDVYTIRAHPWDVLMAGYAIVQIVFGFVRVWRMCLHLLSGKPTIRAHPWDVLMAEYASVFGFVRVWRMCLHLLSGKPAFIKLSR